MYSLILLAFSFAALAEEMRPPGGEAMQGSGTKLRRCGHAPVNGIQIYLEVHGPEDKMPLLLLHGGDSTIDVPFGPLAPPACI